jgi:hypothetical protein
MVFRSYLIELSFLLLSVAALVLQCRTAIYASRSENKSLLRQSLLWVFGLGLLVLGSVVLPVVLAQDHTLSTGTYNICYSLQMVGIGLIVTAGIFSARPARQPA